MNFYGLGTLATLMQNACVSGAGYAHRGERGKAAGMRGRYVAVLTRYVPPAFLPTGYGPCAQCAAQGTPKTYQTTSLQFPGASPTEPVPDAPVSLANAPVPPASSPPRAASPALPAVKEEPLDDGEPLFIPDSDGEEDTAPTYAALDEDEAKYKPKVHVSYAGFTVFGKELVCVLEPTAEVVAANPALFEVDDDGTRKEQRQLDVHAKRQWDRPSVSQRQYGREAPAASHAHREDTPLFRGLTPATDNEF